jgi:phage baseplate assembly protein gpV
MSAIILDPAVGDLGLAVFAERDITKAIATKAEGAAPTNRAFDAGDGLYLGGFLNADPTQYVQFKPDGGIDVVSTGTVNVTAAGAMTLTAPSLQVNGPTTFADPINAPEATIGGIAFTTHRHGGVQPGSGTSGTPAP